MIGLTFTFDLPLACVASSPGTVAIEVAGVDDLVLSGHWRVLAAEDNNINQRVLRTLLNQVGIEPAFDQNGREAVESWRRGSFDLILMDIKMPEMDGVEATRTIRRLETDYGFARTLIVAVTANVIPRAHTGTGGTDRISDAYANSESGRARNSQEPPPSRLRGAGTSPVVLAPAPGALGRTRRNRLRLRHRNHSALCWAERGRARFHGRRNGCFLLAAPRALDFGGFATVWREPGPVR
jgi:CheY-like chemotaxis protein